jgi:phosphoribosylformylglycinamidine synthase
MFCVAPPNLPEEAVPPGALRPDYLLRRVVAGVRDYGNRMGVPTNNGSVHFHADFRAKPTVIVGAYGILPEDRARKREPAAGDRIVALGGRTGRDGIHGATFSSTSMTASTIEVNATAVQIGNAVEEKRLLDAVLACRDAGLVRAITDCGAGGFSSAIGEMGEHLGADVQLDNVPLKYPGLAPWEIFISESQERMVLAVAPSDLDQVMSICATYNVEASDLGSFEPTGRLTVRHGAEVIGQLSMEFLHDGLPIRERTGRWQPRSGDETLPRAPSSQTEWSALLSQVLGHPTVASKEAIARQYDHTVQGTAVVGPYGGRDGNGPSDGAVLAPLLGSEHGVVVAHGLNPVLNTFDPYWGGIWAAAEAMANYVAVGGDPREACLIDNFIWPSPTPEALGGLDRALDACVDIMRALKRPFISGKDSLSSTYRHPDGSVIEIPPVLCVSVFGRMESVRAACTAEFKSAGSELALVGAVDSPATGGSIYLEVNGLRGNRPPRVDLTRLSDVLAAVHEAIRSTAVVACHDVSQGGLVVSASEMGFGGAGLGAEIDLAGLEGRPDLAAFNETAGVFLVEMAPGRSAREVFASVPVVVLGRTTDDASLALKHGTMELCRVDLDELEASWRRPMSEVFH